MVFYALALGRFFLRFSSTRKNMSAFLKVLSDRHHASSRPLHSALHGWCLHIWWRIRRLHLFSDYSKDQRRSDDFMETRVKISIDRITYWHLRPSLYSREFEKCKIPVGHLHDDGFLLLRACLHEGGGPQVGEATFGGLTHLSCKFDHIKMRDYMDRRVTSPIWGTPPPCKQALRQEFILFFLSYLNLIIPVRFK